MCKCDGTQLDEILTGHTYHCTNCGKHLTSLYLCVDCGIRHDTKPGSRYLEIYRNALSEIFYMCSPDDPAYQVALDALTKTLDSPPEKAYLTRYWINNKEGA